MWLLFHFTEEPKDQNIIELQKKENIFLGENRGNPHEFSRMVIDSGADLVFGHGPHVLRAVDIYKRDLLHTVLEILLHTLDLIFREIEV